MKINGTTACFPGLSHAQAVKRLHEGVEEMFGPIRTEHIQLCPQNAGRLSPFEARSLATLYPTTQFRLHANVRLQGPHVFVDASNAEEYPEYWLSARPVLNLLCSDVWSIHAGRRRNATPEKMRRNVLDLQDELGITIAVEGLYPAPGDPWLISSWTEYEWLLNSGLSYAIDMSHLNIVFMHEGLWESGLVNELLSSGECAEVHVSINDGHHDAHELMLDPPTWWHHLAMVDRDAVIFTEGNQLRARHARAA